MGLECVDQLDAAPPLVEVDFVSCVDGLGDALQQTLSQIETSIEDGWG
jgi:hypothetical protein